MTCARIPGVEGYWRKSESNRIQGGSDHQEHQCNNMVSRNRWFGETASKKHSFEIDFEQNPGLLILSEIFLLYFQWKSIIRKKNRFSRKMLFQFQPWRMRIRDYIAPYPLRTARLSLVLGVLENHWPVCLCVCVGISRCHFRSSKFRHNSPLFPPI